MPRHDLRDDILTRTLVDCGVAAHPLPAMVRLDRRQEYVYDCTPYGVERRVKELRGARRPSLEKKSKSKGENRLRGVTASRFLETSSDACSLIEKSVG
jgi:hypothetical protein